MDADEVLKGLARESVKQSENLRSAVREMTLKGLKGRELTLTYEGGAQKIMVPENASVSALVPGSRAQLVPGAVDIGLYGAERQVQRRSDLLVGPPLDVPQHDAGSVLGAQAGDPGQGHARLSRILMCLTGSRERPLSVKHNRPGQCTLTACNSLLQALAIAASLLSVSMIGVPSAECSANSFRPGAIFGAWGNSPGTSSERICFT